MFFKDHLPKPMLATEILPMIDKNLDNFKYCGCDFNCVKQLYKCDNKGTVSRYVCYNLCS